MIFLVLFSLVIILFINNHVSYFVIDGSSMEPTYKSGNALVVTKEKKIANNQMVFFNKPDSWNYSGDNQVLLSKRISASPGDRLDYDGNSFKVNGNIIFSTNQQQYPCNKGMKGYSHILKDNEIWVTGDNYSVSLDSRRIFCQGLSDDSYITTDEVLDHGRVLLKW